MLHTDPETFALEIMIRDSTFGYNSLDHFSRIYKKYTGMSPGEYRKKYAGR